MEYNELRKLAIKMASRSLMQTGPGPTWGVECGECHATHYPDDFELGDYPVIPMKHQGDCSIAKLEAMPGETATANAQENVENFVYRMIESEGLHHAEYHASRTDPETYDVDRDQDKLAGAREVTRTILAGGVHPDDPDKPGSIQLSVGGVEIKTVPMPAWKARFIRASGDDWSVELTGKWQPISMDVKGGITWTGWVRSVPTPERTVDELSAGKFRGES